MPERRGFRYTFATIALFTALAGDAVRYSLTWWGWGIISAAVIAGALAILWQHRGRVLGALPYPLVAFLVLATVSVAWSYYPLATLAGALSTFLTVAVALAIAVAFTWGEILRILGWSLRAILGLSILFEFIVSAFIRRPILPPWFEYPDMEKVPNLLYWSRDLLFEGGKIQGIVGNSSLLAFLGLLGVIVFGIQLAQRSVSRAAGSGWLAVAVFTVAITRSATIFVAVAVLAAVIAAVLLVRRAKTVRGRAAVYGAMAAIIVAAAVVTATMSSQLLALLGKSSDLTGRIGIWTTVIEMAQQRPVAGWGWISYWAPWVKPFDTLVFHAGVRQLHAHNAWLDIWMQLGIIGLVVFGTLVLSTVVRSWLLASDRPQFGPSDVREYSALSLMPLLIMVALVVQSVAESRLLIEYGLLLLVIVAVKSRQQDAASELA